MVMRPYGSSKPNGKQIVSELKKLQSPDKLPATAIEDGVLSVNGQTGVVEISAKDVGAAQEDHAHNIEDVEGLREELDNKISTGEGIPYSSLTGIPEIPEVIFPVDSVNGKTGDVVLTAKDLDAAEVEHIHTISDVSGLSEALSSKLDIDSQIPYSLLKDAPVIPAPQVQADWNESNTTAVNYIKNKPSIPVVNYPVTSVNGQNGDVEITPQSIGAITSSAVPTKVSQLTNDSGFLTSAPVTSVNGKTGVITLSASDIGAASSGQVTKHVRATGTQANGVKVKYYIVTADSTGVWNLNLTGEGWTEILDVQTQAVSTASNVGGIRQASINAYTATSSSLSGVVWGNNLIISILLSGTNSLSLIPNSTVRIRVEGIGS